MLSKIVALALLAGCFAMPMNSTEMPDTVETTTELDCTLYRPYPTNDNMYEVYTGTWENRTCLQALVWDQILCRCENPPFDDIECPGKREVPTNPKQYQTQIWGVWQETPEECGKDQIWNQTLCRCVWDPEGPGAVVEGPGYVFPSHVRSCEIMFNATFDKEIVEHQANYYIGRGPLGTISIKDVAGAIGGGAARLDNGKMLIWSLAGNDFSNAFQIKLNFKLDNTSSTEYVTLFSNDCVGGEESMVLQYLASSNMYNVYVRDSNSSVSLDCQATSTLVDFHTVSLEYQNDVLVLKVDDENVCSSDKLRGNPALTSCPLTLGGDLFMNRNLQGYLDEVLIRRNCVIQP